MISFWGEQVECVSCKSGCRNQRLLKNQWADIEVFEVRIWEQDVSVGNQPLWSAWGGSQSPRHCMCPGRSERVRHQDKAGPAGGGLRCRVSRRGRRNEGTDAAHGEGKGEFCFFPFHHFCFVVPGPSHEECASRLLPENRRTLGIFTSCNWGLDGSLTPGQKARSHASSTTAASRTVELRFGPWKASGGSGCTRLRISPRARSSHSTTSGSRLPIGSPPGNGEMVQQLQQLVLD